MLGVTPNGGNFELTRDTSRTYEDQLLFRMAVNWQNSGSTPALNSVVFCDCIIQEPSKEVPHGFSWKPISAEQKTTVIGPNRTVSTRAIILTRSEIISVAKREIRIFIISEAKYETIFRSLGPRSTKYCFEIVPLGGPENFLGDDLEAEQVFQCFNFISTGSFNSTN